MNTVPRQDGSIRRRHGCRYCQIRWTSSESIDSGSLLSAFVPRPAIGDQPLVDRDPLSSDAA
jgi:hypothetical protein